MMEGTRPENGLPMDVALGLSKPKAASRNNLVYSFKKKMRDPTHKTAESGKVLADYLKTVEKDKRLRSLTVQSSTGVAGHGGSSDATNMVSEGNRALAHNRSDEALSCFLEAARTGDASSELYTQIAHLFSQKELTTEALEYYTKAVMLDPLLEENYLSRAECYLEIDSPADAFAEFEKYFKLIVPSKALLVRCGKSALDADLVAEAERYLQLALAKTDEVDPPTDAYAFYNLGELAERQKDDVQATQYYSQVCLADATFPDPYEEQAEAELTSGNNSLSLHLFEAVAKMKPKDPMVFRRLAQVYTRLGEEFSGSVLTCLTRASELIAPEDPMLEQVLVDRARMLLRHLNDENVDHAIADLTLCLDLNHENADALESRGWALQTRGQSGDVEASSGDYQTFVGLAAVEYERKSYPYRCLALRSCEEGDYVSAAKSFAFAGACGNGIRPEDIPYLNAAMSHVASPLESFEEQYEPRPTAVKEQEKGAKKGAEPVKHFPVAPLSYQLLDCAYAKLRENEPTVHSEVEYEFIKQWKPHREVIERAKEDSDAHRGGKKGAAKRK